MTRTLTTVAAALLALALTAPAALAADGENTRLDLPADEAAKTVATQPGAGSGDVMRAIIGLLVVCGLIYGLYWVLRQVKRSREEQHSGTGLHQLATLPLGPNRALHLIRAGREIVLVGVAEHGVVPIRTYSEHEARALGLVEGESATAAAAHETLQDLEQDLPFTFDVMDDVTVGATDGSHPAATANAGAGWMDQLRRRTVI